MANGYLFKLAKNNCLGNVRRPHCHTRHPVNPLTPGVHPIYDFRTLLPYFFVIFHLRGAKLYASLVLYNEQLKLIPRHFWASGRLYQVPGQEKRTSEGSRQEWRGTSRNRPIQTG